MPQILHSGTQGIENLFCFILNIPVEIRGWVYRAWSSLDSGLVEKSAAFYYFFQQDKGLTVLGIQDFSSGVHKVL